MNQQPLGILLRELREESGVSMRSLAISVDMDPAYLSRMENGKSGEPKAETVERLADALCEVKQLPPMECRRLKRRLLEAAGHIPDREAQIDDLAEGFAARLRDQGFSEQMVDDVLARVALPTMRAILLGKERLEVALAGSYSPKEIAALRRAGEQVIDLGFSNKSSSYMDDMKSAAQYLDRHAEEFTSGLRQKRARSTRAAEHVIRAGMNAEIHVKRTLNKEQEHQLRLIGKLIDTITRGQ